MSPTLCAASAVNTRQCSGTVSWPPSTPRRGRSFWPTMRGSAMTISSWLPAWPLPITAFPGRPSRAWGCALAGRGVDVRLGAAIAEITPNRVLLADGSALPSDITVWAAGVAAPEAVRGWGLPQADDGRIRTGPDLRVTGHEEIFAIGDI